MSDYYRTTYGADGRRKQKSVLGILFDSLIFVVTCVVALIFVATLFVPMLDPRRWGDITTLGLVAPFVYAAQLIVTLYWIIRWRMWVAGPLILLSIVGLFSLSSFYSMEVRRTYGGQKYDRTAIKVMTYNVRSFIDDNGERSIDSMVALIKSMNPDILCLQEFGFREAIDTMLKPMNPLPKTLSRNNLSPAIYSRYPIAQAQRIDTMKEVVWADVVVREDTFRVFNTHLHSTEIRRTDSQYIENHEYLEDESSEQHLKEMIHRLSENNKSRAYQVDTIAQMIEASPYPVIVCGDFNDVPVSHTYRRMSHRLRDAFREKGRGYSHTYRGFFDMLRIDYVLCSKHFSVLSYDVVNSWGLETQKKRGGDTIVVRTFGKDLPIMGDGVRERLDEQTRMLFENDSAEFSNGIQYSDHYPVFVRLQYNGR
ncbi:MAG: endonuclease/exonuclease/phosphatase family protein [Alistipes sp.]|nr:endonuclease/exonuclease/phosphatase family protein [Alistipes sp.]